MTDRTPPTPVGDSVEMVLSARDHLPIEMRRLHTAFNEIDDALSRVDGDGWGDVDELTARVAALVTERRDALETGVGNLTDRLADIAATLAAVLRGEHPADGAGTCGAPHVATSIGRSGPPREPNDYTEAQLTKFVIEAHRELSNGITVDSVRAVVSQLYAAVLPGAVLPDVTSTTTEYGSYNPSTRSLSVDVTMPEADVINTIAHEVRHARQVVLAARVLQDAGESNPNWHADVWDAAKRIGPLSFEDRALGQACADSLTGKTQFAVTFAAEHFAELRKHGVWPGGRMTYPAGGPIPATGDVTYTMKRNEVYKFDKAVEDFYYARPAGSPERDAAHHVSAAIYDVYRNVLPEEIDAYRNGDAAEAAHHTLFPTTGPTP